MKTVLLFLLLPLTAMAYNWYASDYSPYIHAKDSTHLRIYGNSMDQYAEVTITYHGNMDQKQLIKRIKEAAKKIK